MRSTDRRSTLIQAAIILGYTAGITLANLTIVWFGKWATPVNAFVLIAFTFIARDALHELWAGKNRVLRMLVLILGAGAVSYLINPDAGRIAIASALAFMLSEFVDWSAYLALDKRPWLVRSNGSNIFGAIADSIAFPWIAFGATDSLAVIMGAQLFAKLAGGAIWSVIFKHTIRPDERRAARAARAAAEARA